MRETGVVVSDGKITCVRFARTSACEKCGACGMTDKQKEIVVEVRNDMDAHAGDRVLVDMPTDKVYCAGMLAYIVPLIGLIVGVSLDKKLNEWFDLAWSDGIAGMLLALILVTAAIFLLKPIERKIKDSAGWLPIIVEVCAPENRAQDTGGKESAPADTVHDKIDADA